MVKSAVAHFGKIDVLVNNAGIFVGKGVEEASMDEWHKLVAVNLTGVVLGTRIALLLSLAWVRIAAIDVQDHPAVAQAFRVTSMPTLVLVSVLHTQVSSRAFLPFLKPCTSTSPYCRIR